MNRHYCNYCEKYHDVERGTGRSLGCPLYADAIRRDRVRAAIRPFVEFTHQADDATDAVLAVLTPEQTREEG